MYSMVVDMGGGYRLSVHASFVDFNTLNLDLDPDFAPKLDPHPGPDLDPGLIDQF